MNYSIEIDGHTFAGRFRQPFSLQESRDFPNDSEAVTWAATDEPFVEAEGHLGLPIDDAVVRVRRDSGAHGMTVAFDEVYQLVDAEVW